MMGKEFQITITAKSQKEATLIEQGLKEPDVKAVAAIIAALRALPSKRAQARVLNYFTDKIAEQQCP